MDNHANNDNHYPHTLSLAHYLQMIIKRIKLFLAILILGFLITIIAFIYKKNNYDYSYNLTPPEYFFNAKFQNIIENTKLNNYVDYYLSRFIQQQKVVEEKDYAKRIQQSYLKAGTSTAFINLSLKGNKNELKMITQTLDDYVQYLQNQFDSSIIQKLKLSLNLNKTTLENKYSSLLKLKNDLDNNTSEVKEVLTHNTSVKSKTQFSQTILESDAYLALANKQFDLSVKLINLKNDINSINLAIDTIQNLQTQGRLIESDQLIGLSKMDVLIIGIILTIILAFTVVLLIESIRLNYAKTTSNKSMN
ncbi:MAG: hypothetical protein EP298_05270 [Gammaproteobacteria bacterium]|nr:MAG: hypothetical protein EP298_05270 [Gammaproteobacteria bacterium]UTW42466.1 hypothetical protein KFE69_13485 [bacterium SCSIO 12844]